MRQNTEYKTHQQFLNSEKGFTLVEVMIAMVTLLIGILGVMIMQYMAVRGNTTSREVRTATSLAVDMLEQLEGTPYPSLSNTQKGSDIPFTIPDPASVTATRGGITYTRAWWFVADCVTLGGNGITCSTAAANDPGCIEDPDPAVATPIAAIRARTCWIDSRDGLPHSVTIDTKRLDETSAP